MSANNKIKQFDTCCELRCVCLEIKGGCAQCSFDSDQTVHVWYRREIGQNVLREVTTKDVSAACGKVCN